MRTMITIRSILALIQSFHTQYSVVGKWMILIWPCINSGFLFFSKQPEDG